MTVASASRLPRSARAGGSLIGGAGLLAAVQLALPLYLPVLLPASAVAFAAGCLLLVVGPGGGVTGPAAIGRAALVLTGVGPLAFEVPFAASQPAAIVAGMSVLWLVTAATVLAAIAILRAGVLSGAARWASVALALDAFALATLSTVSIGVPLLVLMEWRVDLLRPLILLVWGGAVLLTGRGPAIRGALARAVADWKRTTDVRAR